jgi:branched-chain amino acid transport system permease protein
VSGRDVGAGATPAVRPARPPWLGLAALAAALALPHLVYPVLAADILAWGLFAVAFDVLLGFTGLLSFGHAAFWGSSAYATGYLLKAAGLPVPAALLGGVLVALALAVPVAALSIRRQGIYFSMITLAFAQMVYFVALQATELTGGENGVQAIPRPPLLGLDLGDPVARYYLILALAGLGFLVAWRTVRSPFGRALRAIRDNEPRAQSLGYRTPRFKLVAMLISAGLTGLAGGLYALAHGVVALEVVHWTTSGLVVMMTILGGIGTLWGPVLGAVVVLVLRDRLASSPGRPGVVTGGIFIAILFLRYGVRWPKGSPAARWLRAGR